jgi:hypothetical protein
VFPVGIGLRDPRSQKRDLGHPSISPFNVADGTSLSFLSRLALSESAAMAHDSYPTTYAVISGGPPGCGCRKIVRGKRVSQSGVVSSSSVADERVEGRPLPCDFWLVMLPSAVSCSRAASMRSLRIWRRKRVLI